MPFLTLEEEKEIYVHYYLPSLSSPAPLTTYIHLTHTIHFNYKSPLNSVIGVILINMIICNLSNYCHFGDLLCNNFFSSVPPFDTIASVLSDLAICFFLFFFFFFFFSFLLLYEKKDNILPFTLSSKNIKGHI